MLYDSTYAFWFNAMAFSFWVNAEDHMHLSPYLSYVSGALAGCAATLGSYPFDLLRTILASQGEPKVLYWSTELGLTCFLTYCFTISYSFPVESIFKASYLLCFETIEAQKFLLFCADIYIQFDFILNWKVVKIS